MDCRCPKCSSNDTKIYPIIYEEGTHNLEFTTVGTAFSAEMIVGTAHSKGGIRSTLSEKLAPPQKEQIPFSGVVFLFLIPLLICAFLLEKVFKEPEPLFWLLCPIIITPFLFLIYRAFVNVSNYNKKEWPVHMKIWEKSFFCTRCGHTFMLDEHARAIVEWGTQIGSKFVSDTVASTGYDKDR